MARRPEDRADPEDGGRRPLRRPRWSQRTADDLPVPVAVLDHLHNGAAVELIYVHVPFLADLDTASLGSVYDRVQQRVLETLWDFLADLGVTAGVIRWPADDYVAWLADTVESPMRPLLDPEETAVACGILLRQAVARDVSHPVVQDRIDELTVARAPVSFSPDQPPARRFARAVRRAQQAACDPLAQRKQRAARTLAEAIGKRAFEYHYQPIVDVVAGEVLAYEALIRGTSDPLRFPDVIFGTAERCGSVWELSRCLRELLARDVERDDLLPPTLPSRRALVFMNVHPCDLEDPVFLEQAISGTLAPHAERIVLELTERAAIADYRRVKAVFSTLRRHGYRLAIDDLGAGYAGLTALAELEPEFIKFDMGLVREIHQQPVKRRLVQRMNEFAAEIGARTISEGVETQQERDALLAIGCRAMQGYLFARPARPPQGVAPGLLGCARCA